MTIAAQLNSRITQLAVGRHLSYRAVRVRLTLLYGGLFLLSGAALMAIAYALLVNAGFVFSIQNGNTTEIAGPPPGSVRSAPFTAIPVPGSATHPSTQTMAHWRAVAQCMRQHGVAGFPEPRSSIPLHLAAFGQIDDRDGAILAIPATFNTQSPTFAQATNACGLTADRTKGAATASHRRTQVRQELVVQSGIALAGMSLLSLFLGWLMAGRVLQPLEDAYQAQRQFVANASHELRAPLTRQRALLEVALADPDANFSSLRAAQERVLASEQHLEQLIDALLALTRGQAGLQRRERFDLAALASQALQTRDSEIANLGLDVRASLDAAPTAGDPRLLERLIANLIDNAMRHNTRGGHVQITTGTRDRHAFVSVENGGPTVPPEQIQRLFQPFERLGDARTGHSSGHGLGLSIVQAIADAHGAELSARPGPAGGLMIEVSFPSAVGAASGIRFAPAWAKRASPRTSLQD